MTAPLLSVRALSLGFARKPILPPFDLTIRSGELWGVIGRNGAGKSTFFRTLLGLHPAVSGVIDKPSSTVIGYVPQRYAVDPLVPARAGDLIEEGALRGLSFLRPFRSEEQRKQIAEAAEITGASAFLHRRYRDLSEGEKQRVLLARAVAGAPNLLVLDEPTSAMDVVAEREVVAILNALKERFSMGILLVSHHLGLVLSICDRALFLDADDGIATSGTAREVTHHPVFRERYGALHTCEEEAAS